MQNVLESLIFIFCSLNFFHLGTNNGGIKVKFDNQTLELIKVLSLVVIAISTSIIALWVSQIPSLLGGISENLGGISTSLFDYFNKE